ncbi:CaiB/BaiF CoA transferase family protein [Natrialba asiatica]|uniref:Formyl-CoA transferase n=1 Tax=Natrialba asiatica (strain ATCC 700177 / DSM 12278 / JCM 9576 / FERM P-10747 / NBRC 102637 / 172P1) TaxID=29540 RepID=M0B529_NATA1|nr:CoA transferase [Natrialba asiatica]ELZ05920.1 Formyl-CoA transferase [Natrialba asiatica DSM 12278]
MGDGPLADVSVVEMTGHRAGPFCGALLADMGADVVKIERPGVGDPARSQGIGPEGKSGYFMANNRNKRSVTLDLKSSAGREAALELLADADVFVENFGYGVTDKLGIGYDDVRERNPDIVYASIKGYGETGPMKEKPGLDLILQAEGGIMSVTGPEDGAPVKVGQAIGDLTTGMFAALGVLARLYERDRADDFTGKFDIGLFDSIVALLNEYLTEYSMDGSVPGPQGVTHQTLVPYQRFETADSAIVTGVPSDDRWDDFVDLLGRDELHEYPTNEARRENAARVIDIIQAELESESAEFWLDRLTEYGFPCGPINDVADVVENDQTAARDLVVPHEDPDWGECVLPGHPINFPDYDTDVRSPAPRLGEHTEAVFADVVDDQTTLEEWTEDGAFGEN